MVDAFVLQNGKSKNEIKGATNFMKSLAHYAKFVI